MAKRGPAIDHAPAVGMNQRKVTASGDGQARVARAPASARPRPTPVARVGTPAALASIRAYFRRPAVPLAIAGVTLFALYAWMGQYGIDLVDEGYFLDFAHRVYQGALPYRDFDTYYTPGVFYLYAALFKAFGVSVVPVRLIVAGVRVLCLLLLYGLARRIAPRPFALLPPLVLAAMDPIPVTVEPHPAWFGLLATLLTMEAVVRHDASERSRWLVLAGAAAGVAFLFKQNVGAFAALAVGSYVLLRPVDQSGWLIRGLRVAWAAALAVAATILLRSALDGPVAITLWLPLLATLVYLVVEVQPGGQLAGWGGGLRPAVTGGVYALAGFGTVTLVWLLPLTSALGLSATPFGLFLGAVNQGALAFPLDGPPDATVLLVPGAVVLPMAFARLPRQVAPGVRWQPATLGLATFLAVAWLPRTSQPSDFMPFDVETHPLLAALAPQLATLFLFLPAAAAWAGLTVLVLQGRHARTARPATWFLLIGVLAALAFYPRFDTPHALFAGPPLLVVGAWALARAHRALVGRAKPLRQALVFVALLLIPAAALLPHVAWRYLTIVEGDPSEPAPTTYVPLGFDRATVLVPRRDAENLGGAVQFIRAHSAPGESLLAYPVDPMVNFLADRPNPTRFDHFLPGALTPEDMDGVIADLKVARPRFVLWDDGAVNFWQTDPANRPLSDYIWQCYRQVATYDYYLILERQGC